MITNFNISNLYVSYGKIAQNVPTVLLTGHWCSVGSLSYDLQEFLSTSNAYTKGGVI
jgi:hypothetical protein